MTEQTKAMPTSVELVDLRNLRTDGGTQIRSAIRLHIVREYAEAYRRRAPMPPLVAFLDDGGNYWLADGFHRRDAMVLIRREWAEVIVHRGTRRDAILFAVGANAEHGLRRTNADKRRAVEILLRDEDWSKRSDRWIARQAGVSQPFTSRLRAELAVVLAAGGVTAQGRRGFDGKTYPATRPTQPRDEGETARSGSAHRFAISFASNDPNVMASELVDRLGAAARDLVVALDAEVARRGL